MYVPLPKKTTHMHKNIWNLVELSENNLRGVQWTLPFSVRWRTLRGQFLYWSTLGWLIKGVMVIIQQLATRTNWRVVILRDVYAYAAGGRCMDNEGCAYIKRRLQRLLEDFVSLQPLERAAETMSRFLLSFFCVTVYTILTRILIFLYKYNIQKCDK